MHVPEESYVKHIPSEIKNDYNKSRKGNNKNKSQVPSRRGISLKFHSASRRGQGGAVFFEKVMIFLLISGIRGPKWRKQITT
jgi:hypothetical protein